MSRYLHWETCWLSLCDKTVFINPSASVGIYNKFYPPNEIMWNASLMQLGNFIDVFLAWHVSGTYGHHQEH